MAAALTRERHVPVNEGERGAEAVHDRIECNVQATNASYAFVSDPLGASSISVSNAVTLPGPK